MLKTTKQKPPLPMNNHVSILKINRDAIAHNIAFFRSKIDKNTKILVVVKAFGYGSDAIKISQFLQEKKLANYLAVAYAHEGIALRKNGVSLPILVLHPQIDNLQSCIDHNLEPNLYNFDVLKAFQVLLEAKKVEKYPIHIKINTGLNRLGFLPSEVSELTNQLKATNTLEVVSVFSHLAASEDLKEKDFTLIQIDEFRKASEAIIKQLPNKPMRHMLNTSGIVNYAEQAQFDMVRLGIGTYGFANDKKTTKQLECAVSLESKISQITTIEANETVGYNRAFKTSKTMRVATVPIGHADGLSRKLGNKKGCVYIQGKKAPIVGNVCMDMIMVDVTNIDCKVQDEVIVFNNQKQLKMLAKASKTITYELLTALSQRVKRIFI